MLILETVFGRIAFDQEVAYSDPPRHTGRWAGLLRIEDGSNKCWTHRVSEGEIYLRFSVKHAVPAEVRRSC